MKKISCGVVIINELDEVLMAHSTGNKFFDLPKGGMDEEESYLDCALRETKEETSIVLDPTRMVDLGLFKYNKEKDIYLFEYRVNKSEINVEALVCESFFEHHYTKKMTPEADYFQWIHTSELQNNCAKSMGNLLNSLFNMENTNKSKNKL